MLRRQRLSPEVPERRHRLGWAKVGPDDAAGLVHRVGRDPDPVGERMQLAALVDALAADVELPAVVDAAQPAPLVAAEE